MPDGKIIYWYGNTNYTWVGPYTMTNSYSNIGSASYEKRRIRYVGTGNSIAGVKTSTTLNANGYTKVCANIGATRNNGSTYDGYDDAFAGIGSGILCYDTQKGTCIIRYSDKPVVEFAYKHFETNITSGTTNVYGWFGSDYLLFQYYLNALWLL